MKKKIQQFTSNSINFLTISSFQLTVSWIKSANICTEIAFEIMVNFMFLKAQNRRIQYRTHLQI